MTARPAATVVVARHTEGGSYEVLLTRRPKSMAFMGGTFVFPGGAVDPADAAPQMRSRSRLRAPEALDRLGEPLSPEESLAIFCTALRELYEEAGILVACKDSGKPVDPAKVREVYAPHHTEVGDDPATFARFLEDEGLLLCTDLLVPRARLITPEQAPIRFDARFFVTPLPEGQAVIPHPTEVVDWLWIGPALAVERARKKELDVPIPTLAILQGLAETPGYEQVTQQTQLRREVEAEELSDLVCVVRAPNPGLMTGGGTNTYVVGRGDVAIIDPATPDPVYIERVMREALNRGRPRLILLTHNHIDHIGGVVPLTEQLPVDVGAFAPIGDPPFVTRTLADEESIELGGASLRALHTPGHASNHLCFLLEEHAEGGAGGAEGRSVFAGDVVAGFGTVVISPPDGNLRDYMATLDRLVSLSPRRIYPGHGPVITEGIAKLEEYIAHRRERTRQVIEALEAGKRRIPDMVKRIYAEVPEVLHPMAQRSVLAHLEMLAEEGRVTSEGETWSLKS